jgi:hypothetical protein
VILGFTPARFGFCGTRLRRRELALAVLAVQFQEFQELDVGWLFEFDAQLTGDLPQSVVKVREMVDGHVAYEGAANFVVACAAMQPPQKDEKLDERGKSDDNPVGIH